MTKIDDKLHWFKDATIYELHIKAYKDGNGDGIGDFKGLLENLDYLQELGVTAIWVLPFYPSPLKDDGYDIADYYNINPRYGNMDDFKAFVAEAHRRNLKVITELVINHTSDQHEWFQKARNAPKDSPERNWYVWSDNPNQYSDVRIIFTDTEPSNWTFDPVAGQYFWHRFFAHQPDLNFDNPDVQNEIFNILDYWADMGVDGFRLDAIPYLFEREDTNSENLPETHEFLKKIRRHVDEKYPGLFLLAEANMWPEDSASYFGNGDECHMNFHFPIMPRMFMALKMEDRNPITDILEQTPPIPETCQWGMFLRNHDELTLEMVTEEERDFMYKNYAPDLTAKINVGIRRRLAPLLDNDRRKIELLNVLLFSMPGTPVIYYGDEIGMGDNFYLKDRDGVRTPMQWSPTKNGGFSDANPHRLYLPVIANEDYNPDVVNVQVQRQNPNSQFSWVKNMIATRKKFKAFGRGDIQFLQPENSRILAFIRSYENEKILVVVNLSKNPQAVELDLSEFSGFTPTEIFSQNKFPKIKKDPYLFTLGSHGYYWLSLENEKNNIKNEGKSPLLAIESWESFIKGNYNTTLTEDIFPAYFQTCRWYGGKAKNIQQISIKAGLPFGDILSQEAILLVQVAYTEGFPDLYLFPIAFDSGDKAKNIIKNSPKSLICEVEIGKEKGILYDAVYSENFRSTLWALAVDKEVFQDQHLRLFSENSIVFDHLPKSEKSGFSSELVGADQSNTAIIYGNKFFLKLYRKLDNTINPDVEVSRFLTEIANFPNTPRFYASINFGINHSENFEIGMIQHLAENKGDAWTYIGNELKPEIENWKKSSVSVSSSLTENIKLLAKRTAEMHISLASKPFEQDFEPEEFSLHYQSSLYAGLYSLVRANFQTLTNQLPILPDSVKTLAEEIMLMRPEILKCLKRIAEKKLETQKIRTHGDYHLGQVLFTGNDFVIIDFEGEPARPFSERRLKRSPLKDVAGMLRSFHYAAYSALFQAENMSEIEMKQLHSKAEEWYNLVYDLFLNAYLETVGHRSFIPQDKSDFQIILETFILEKAVYELNYELVYRPDWVVIPMVGIKSIMTGYLEKL